MGLADRPGAELAERAKPQAAPRDIMGGHYHPNLQVRDSRVSQVVSNTLREAAKQQVDLTKRQAEVGVKAEPYLDEDKSRQDQMLHEEQAQDAQKAAAAKGRDSSTKEKKQE